jgi:hypothetical protein
MTASRTTPESVWATGAQWRESFIPHDDALVFSDTSPSRSLFAVSDFIVPDLWSHQRYEEVHSAEGSSNLAQAVTTKKRYSSSNNDLMRNRTRRVIAPVIGNNNVGKRGKIRARNADGFIQRDLPSITCLIFSASLIRTKPSARTAVPKISSA